MKTKLGTPTQYAKGTKVRDIYTGEVFTVKRSYWQAYAGGDTSDYTVELEPTDSQPTPWNKSCNLVLAITKANSLEL